MDQCIYCDNKKLYTLATGDKKCALCRRKFSPKKVACQRALLEAFCQEESAHATAKKYGMHYQSVHKRFMKFRLSAANYLQKEFYNNLENVTEYEEYIYLPRYKTKTPQSLYGSHDLLIFDYNGYIDTTLIRFEERYTPATMELKELKKLVTTQKIAKLRTRENTISRFVDFLEMKMKRFKGVGKEQFFYYLKECEFCFNHTQEKRKSLLETIAAKAFLSAKE